MLPQFLFSGLVLGSIYGLVALGFAVIYKATQVFNFAQGMLMVCGAYLAVAASFGVGTMMAAAKSSQMAGGELRCRPCGEGWKLIAAAGDGDGAAGVEAAA